LLPLPPPPAPPPSSVIQTPISGPPLLLNPTPTFSNVVNNTRPINVYNVTINVDHNNETDNEDTDLDNDVTDTDFDSDDTDVDETNINDPTHFPKFLLKYFKDYYPF
jgi:hypothetical protein